MEFGERLRQLREEREMTREALASTLSISYSAVAKYETNIRFPDKDTLNKIADFFEVSTDYLLGRTNIKESADKVINQSMQTANKTSSKNTNTAEKGLPPEAIEEIENFKGYVKHKYKK